MARCRNGCLPCSRRQTLWIDALVCLGVDSLLLGTTAGSNHTKCSSARGTQSTRGPNRRSQLTASASSSRSRPPIPSAPCRPRLEMTHFCLVTAPASTHRNERHPSHRCTRGGRPILCSGLALANGVIGAGVAVAPFMNDCMLRTRWLLLRSVRHSSNVLLHHTLV